MTSELRLNGIDAKLRALAGSMRNRKPLLLEIGDFVVGSVQKNFAEQRAPDGTPWKGLKNPRPVRGRVSARRLAGTIAVTRLAASGYRVRSYKILEDTGRLLRSIHRTATNEDVRIGTDVIYSRVHQFGYPRRDIPARPYIGLRQGDEAAIVAIAERWQRREIQSAGLEIR